MNYLFAPMEGITYYHYRNLHHQMFGCADAYYSPFIAPDSKGSYKAGNLKEILPENNQDIRLIPQILANNAPAFLSLAEELKGMGYSEVNLNAGCPSGTVVAKHKGAGMLASPDDLDHFLDEVFSRCSLKISVKTRMGISSTAEFEKILPIYNKYPICNLIIHARDRVGKYVSMPDMEAFRKAFSCARLPVCYNGNVFSCSDAENISAQFPSLSGIMIGRGAIANPALFRVIQNGNNLTAAELREFHNRLLELYLADGLYPRFAVMRMKEIWYYIEHMFYHVDKPLKRLRKAVTLEDYQSAVDALFQEAEFCPTSAFSPPMG